MPVNALVDGPGFDAERAAPVPGGQGQGGIARRCGIGRRGARRDRSARRATRRCERCMGRRHCRRLDQAHGALRPRTGRAAGCIARRSCRGSGARSRCRSPPTNVSARSTTPGGLRALDAADAIVLKQQPLGGVRAALAIAEEAGVPAIVSSMMETSVGLAAGVALAAALPELRYACGLATLSRDRGRRGPRPARTGARRRARAYGHARVRSCSARYQEASN